MFSYFCRPLDRLAPSLMRQRRAAAGVAGRTHGRRFGQSDLPDKPPSPTQSQRSPASGRQNYRREPLPRPAGHVPASLCQCHRSPGATYLLDKRSAGFLSDVIQRRWMQRPIAEVRAASCRHTQSMPTDQLLPQVRANMATMQSLSINTILPLLPARRAKK